MFTGHAIRGVQALLVVGALTFAVVGLAAPQEAFQQGACAVANPRPPCTCGPSDDCIDSCWGACGGPPGMGYCVLNDTDYPHCEPSPDGTKNGLCYCVCG